MALIRERVLELRRGAEGLDVLTAAAAGARSQAE